jgi:hypothetical protein
VSDLHAPSTSEVWILTAQKGLLRWSAGDWELHPLTALGPRRVPYRLHAVEYSVAEERGTEVWLAGEGPTLARYRIVAPVVQLYVPVTKNE